MTQVGVEILDDLLQKSSFKPLNGIQNNHLKIYSIVNVDDKSGKISYVSSKSFKSLYAPKDCNDQLNAETLDIFVVGQSNLQKL